MPWYTDQNGFEYYVDDNTGAIVTPVTGTPVNLTPPPTDSPN